MDISSIVSALMSDSTVSAVAEKANASKTDVTSVFQAVSGSSDVASIAKQVLGGSTASIESEIAKKTGLDSKIVSSIVSAAKPYIKKALGGEGADLSSIAGMVGGLFNKK